MPMAVREFRDSHGGTWRVWANYPPVTGILGAGLEGGWLTFDSGTRRKRLAPIPKGWGEATDVELEIMCTAAEIVGAGASGLVAPD
jgi:hypothetical protein